VSKTTLWEFEKHIIKFNDHHTECRSFYFKLLDEESKKEQNDKGSWERKTGKTCDDTK